MSDTKPDEYGLMRAGLERIINWHQKRREQQEQPPAVELFAPDGPVAEEPSELNIGVEAVPEVEQPAPEPVELTDFTDGTWIEQRRPEWQWFDGFPVLTNRYTVSYRKRTAEDGGKAVEFLPIQLPKQRETETITWPNPFNAEAGQVRHLDDTVRKQWIGGPKREEEERVARPDSSGRYHAPRQGVRYDVNTGEPI